MIYQIENELWNWRNQGYEIYPLADFYSHSNMVPSFVTTGLPPEGMANQISNITDRPVIEDSYVIIRYDEYNSDKAKQQLMKSQWDQKFPFTMALPTYNSNPNSQMGCTAVATSQIIAYKRYLTGFNYDAMFENPCNYSEISRLIYHVGQAIGIRYSVGESTATINDVKNGLSRLDLTYNYRSNFDVANIVASINSDIPVYVRATDKTASASEGHAWVVDGYKNREVLADYSIMLLHANAEDSLDGSPFWRFSNQYASIISEKFYHCNWGKRGLYDGFYQNGAFNPGSNNFNSAVQAITFIKKK